jgi:ATP-dependent DNA helicase RecQ
MHDLLGTLRTTFGHHAFRPLQREIIEASLAGRDVFALLPTGGGKSLCFQLPSLLRAGLTVVVSPLIALMKDQVDQLRAAGVAATFLNSSLEADEVRARLRGLHEGRYRLLYVAPERVLLQEWRENLLAWNVGALVIDEAHCVSEWGHDFRPEYRQLAALRTLLPDAPIVALTATATLRVRDDIIGQLQLRDPAVFTASFNRPNLWYRVIAKNNPLEQLREFLATRRDESGIIYCATRATTETLAEALRGAGLSARAYHAGLDAGERAEVHDLFLNDEARVVCATIAFGMGINKPDVRWIVHHDLPRSIEGYYQETGRAGRDGLPADCLLLFNPGDAARQTYFINQVSDPAEQAHARDQLRQIQHYAESSGCRRRGLLAYFGETYVEENCEACDNCASPRERYDGTVPAQKLLSCVYRIVEASGFTVGLNHVVEVLRGADTLKIRQWGHERLSTYGIGKELSRAEWVQVGRELVRMGLLAQAGGNMPTLSLSEPGRDILRSRRPILLTRPIAPPKETASTPKSTPRAGAIECDEALFERLKALRKQLSSERKVPAYIILGDVSLRQMARDLPTTLDDLGEISGVGAKKLADFGEVFVREIRDYLGMRTGRTAPDRAGAAG